MKNPYKFGARSRKVMIEYITDRGRYCNNYNERFPLAWNVKTYKADWQHPKGDYALDESLDDAWQKEMGSDAYFEVFVYENVCHYYLNDWTSYPGDDQGYWKFDFVGRSGGWLALTHWRGVKFSGMDKADFAEWLNELIFDDLRSFYRGIVCANDEFTQDNASKNVELEVNIRRHEWETELKEAKEAALSEFVQSYESSRPDMYEAQ